MQEVLSSLKPPIAIILIVAGVIALVIVALLARRLRRRQTSLDDSMSASTGLSGPVDYTALPLDDDPAGWRERFANLSLAGKILIILVPLLVLLGVLVLVLSLMSGSQPPPQARPLPTSVPVKLTITKAEVIRINPVTVSIAAETTGLADGTQVTAELLANGQPVTYLNADGMKGAVRSGQISIKPAKDDLAGPLSAGVTYIVRLNIADDQTSAEHELLVPSDYANTIFGTTPVASATSTPAPTSATASPQTTPGPTATASAVALSGTEVKVRNGGKVRSMPFTSADNRVGGVDASNTVQLIERTPNAEWYHISFINTDDGQRKDGWISASLLIVPAAVQAKVPVATVVSVFVGGPMYQQPDKASSHVDSVNVGEVVKLKQKKAAGDWYQVENVRGKTGWVPANLLGIPADVAAKVSVAP
jgi:hypothetical protein